MKRTHWWLSSLLVLAFVAAPALAKKEAGPGGEKKKRDRAGKKERKPGAKKAPRQSGMVKQITEVCGLTAEQQTALQEALKPYLAAQKDAKDKGAELRKAAAEARKAKDKDKMKDIGKQMKELQKPVEEALAAAMKTLTPEQQAKWAAHQLAEPILARFKKLGLSEEQVKKIVDLCGAKAAELKDADPKSKRRAMGELTKEVQANILTEDQKAKVKAPKKGGGEKKPRKPKGERKKKDQ